MNNIIAAVVKSVPSVLLSSSKWLVLTSFDVDQLKCDAFCLYSPPKFSKVSGRVRFTFSDTALELDGHPVNASAEIFRLYWPGTVNAFDVRLKLVLPLFSKDNAKLRPVLSVSEYHALGATLLMPYVMVDPGAMEAVSGVAFGNAGDVQPIVSPEQPLLSAVPAAWAVAFKMPL